MKIVGAEVLEYARPLDGRSWNPVSRWTERRAPLLLLHADNGVTGVGEAWSRQERIVEVLGALAQSVEAWSLGRKFDNESAIRTLAANRSHATWAESAAASAIDIALWDLLAKERGEPLWQALGAASGRVRVYASGGLYRDGADIDDLADEVVRHRRDGFVDVKIKVGGMPLADDVRRIRAARAAMDPLGVLWIDAVNQLPPATALASARAYKAAGAQALQAPVAFDDHATMAAINRECMPVIAAESAFARDAFETLLATRSVGMLQFNAGLCGGLSSVLDLAAMAASRSVPVTPQAHATAVLQAAALHAGAAMANVFSVEYHRFHDHLAHLLDAPLRTVKGGHVTLGVRPGLGVDVPNPGSQPDGGSIRLAHRW